MKNKKAFEQNILLKAFTIFIFILKYTEITLKREQTLACRKFVPVSKYSSAAQAA